MDHGFNTKRRADVLMSEVYDISQAMVKLNELSIQLLKKKLGESHGHE